MSCDAFGTLPVASEIKLNIRDINLSESLV